MRIFFTTIKKKKKVDEMIKKKKKNIPLSDFMQIRKTYISEISSREEGLSILSP